MKKYPIDKNLFYMPGIVNEIVEMTERNAPHPNLPISFIGAVSLLANVMGARYRSEENIQANMYNVVIANSGTGKDAPRQTNKMIGHELKKGDNPAKIEIIENVASFEGIESIFSQNRNDLLLQIDEIDNLLTCLGDRRNTVFVNLMKNLLTAYTSSNSVMYMRVNKQNVDCKPFLFPNINIFGSCTPQSLYDAMQESMIERGLISRCLFIPSFDRSKFTMPKRIINFSTIDKIKAICNRPYAADYSELQLIPYTDDARQKAVELNATIDEMYSNCQDNTKMILYSRIYEKVVKMAMVYAVSVNHENPVIDSEIFTHCTELIIQSVNWMSADIEGNLFNNQTEKRIKRLYERLEFFGDNIFTKKEIYSHFKTNKNELTVLLDNLLDMQKIEKISSAKGEYFKLIK